MYIILVIVCVTYRTINNDVPKFLNKFINDVWKLVKMTTAYNE